MSEKTVLPSHIADDTTMNPHSTEKMIADDTTMNPHSTELMKKRCKDDLDNMKRCEDKMDMKRRMKRFRLERKRLDEEMKREFDYELSAKQEIARKPLNLEKKYDVGIVHGYFTVEQDLANTFKDLLEKFVVVNAEGEPLKIAIHYNGRRDLMPQFLAECKTIFPMVTNNFMSNTFAVFNKNFRRYQLDNTKLVVIVFDRNEQLPATSVTGEKSVTYSMIEFCNGATATKEIIDKLKSIQLDNFNKVDPDFVTNLCELVRDSPPSLLNPPPTVVQPPNYDIEKENIPPYDTALLSAALPPLPQNELF